MNFHGNSWQNFILNYFLDVLEGFTFFAPLPAGMQWKHSF